MKKAIIIIVSALIVLGGVFAGLWFFTDVLNFLKPANENFSLQLKKVLGMEKNMSYSEYEAKISNFKMDKSFSTDFNVSVNVNVPNSVLSYSDQKLINASSLNLKTDYDVDTKQTAVAIALSNNSKEVIKAQAIQDGAKLSIKSDDLYEKYLTFDLDKYESFCKENGITVDNETKESIELLSKLSKINNNTFLYDLYHISESDYNKLQKNYDNLPTKLIDKSKFKTKKNQKISVGKKNDVKTTAYSVVLTGEDAYNMTKELINLEKNDDTLKKITLEKYNVMKEFINQYSDAIHGTSSTANSSFYSIPDLSIDDIEDSYNESLQNLESSKNDLKNIDGAVKVTIYSDKKNNPVKLEIEILEDEDDDEGDVIFTKEIEKGRDTYTIDLSILNKTASTSSYTTPTFGSSKSSTTSMLNSLASSKTAIKIVDEYEEKSKGNRTGTLSIFVKISGSEYQEAIDVDYELVDSTSEQKVKLSVTTPTTPTTLSKSLISLDLLYDVTGLDTDTKNVKFSLDGKYMSYSLSMNVDGTIKSGANIPSLNSSNSVDICSLKNEEFNTVYKQIINNAANNLPSKLSVYGIKVSKDQILGLLPAEPTTEPVAPVEEPAA